MKSLHPVSPEAIQGLAARHARSPLASGSRRRALRGAAGALLLCGALLTSPAQAQAQPQVPSPGAAAGFPSKPIRIYVPFNAGSGADTSSRFYGEQIGKILGQQVIVENRPGGSGVLAVQATRQAPPDGHTILMGSNSPAVVNAITIKNLPYDPFKDIRPLHGLGISPVAFAVSAQSPHKTVGDLVAAAKRNNQPLQLGNYSAGYQLVAAWLGTASGLPVNHIPYKGGAQMLTDVVGGQLDVGVIDFTGTLELMKGGRIRVLAITGDKRDPSFPNVPTMKESGFPDFETWVWSAFFMHADTPEPLVEKLAAAIRQVMNSDAGRAYHEKNTSVPMQMGPKELGAFQRREYERFKRVADTAGIKPE